MLVGVICRLSLVLSVADVSLSREREAGRGSGSYPSKGKNNLQRRTHVTLLYHPVQVQDDLQLLRTTVARASDGAVHLGALDSVLSRTERGVQVNPLYLQQ